MKKQEKSPIPEQIRDCLAILEKAGFQAFLVGGCVRDIFLGKKPKDWDITTNAKPEQIQTLYPKTVYENRFGTVAVIYEESTDETLKTVEITPFRTETGYSDNRHPDEVKFSDKIEDDLKRRDFTINALAVSITPDGAIKDIIDLFGGFGDLKDKIIRSVNIPEERFGEDALRMMRAIRLAVELDYSIHKDTEEAIKKLSSNLSNISMERVRDEFVKIIMSQQPKKGLEMLHETGLLKQFIPEIEAGIGVEQNQAHSYDVWEHLLRSLQHAADKEWPLDIRLTALFHDISKPITRKFSRETNQYTFYGHEVLGSRETRKILTKLRFPVKTIEKVSKMVRWHMFFSDTEQITLSAVRRMIVNVGKENIWDLMNVRICDRIGTGRPKENPYRLRKYHAMIDEALRDPISVSMLKIDGKRIMELLDIKPGPKVGYILHALLEKVLEDPKLNKESVLEELAVELNKLSEKTLMDLYEKAKTAKDKEEESALNDIRKRHHVS